MNSSVVLRAAAFALVAWLVSTAGASADPIYRVTFQGTGLVGFNETLEPFDTVEPYTAFFDISPRVMPSAEGGAFRFEILRWTDPLSYTDELRQQYWTEPLPSSPSFLTGNWDPEYGSLHVGADMVHQSVGRYIERSLWNGDKHIPNAQLDPVFHLIPMRLHAWESVSGPSGSANYFGGGEISDIAPVPEPATLIFVGTGKAVLALRRRRSGVR